MGGRGDGFTAETTAERLFLVHQGGHPGRQRQEGRAPFIQQPVEHQAQGIEIRGSSVGQIVENLRRHEVFGADDQAAADFFLPFCHAEVSQLVGPFPADKDVLGLYVPVEDLLPVAAGQSRGDIPAQPQDLPLLHAVADLHQRLQQLHFDQHVPARLILVTKTADIVAGNHVGAASQPGHDGIFPHHLFHPVGKKAGDLVLAIALGAELIDLASVPGNGDKFERGSLRRAKDFASDLVDRADGAPSQKADRLPARPYRPEMIIIHSCLPFRVTAALWGQASLRFFA